MADVGRKRAHGGIGEVLSALRVARSEGRELVACLAGLTEDEKAVVSVVCGTLQAIEEEGGPQAALAVLDQITMVLGARRLGDG